MKKFFLIFVVLIGINFLVYSFSEKEYFPENNLVLIEKPDEIITKKILSNQKPEKILSKWIFLDKNTILTVAHWVTNKEINYKVDFFNKKFFSESKLVFKNEENDFALLKTEKSFEKFFPIKFWKITENDEFVYFWDWTSFSKLNFFELKENEFFVEKIFEPWDSWTIFFNKNKEIIWILSEYNLEKKYWIVKILEEKNFYK